MKTPGTYDGERAILVEEGGGTWIVALRGVAYVVLSNDPDDPLWTPDE